MVVLKSVVVREVVGVVIVGGGVGVVVVGVVVVLGWCLLWVWVDWKELQESIERDAWSL